MGLTETRRQGAGHRGRDGRVPVGRVRPRARHGPQRGHDEADLRAGRRGACSARGIVGVNAGELIAETVHALEMGADAEDIGLDDPPAPDAVGVDRHGRRDRRRHDHRPAAEAAGTGMNLGRIGVWRSRRVGVGPAAEIEALGYGALWIGGSPSVEQVRAVPRGDLGRSRCSPASSTSGSTSRRTSPPAHARLHARLPGPLHARHRHRPPRGDERLHAAAEDDARVLRRPRRGRRRRCRARSAWPPRSARRCSTSPAERSLGTHPYFVVGRAHALRARAGRRRRAGGARGGVRRRGGRRDRARPSPASTRRSTCGCATTRATCCASASPRTTSRTAAATG